MMTETEKALLAIADPLVWHWFANDGRNGQPVASSPAGQYWWAKSAGIHYSVHLPLAKPGEVDASIVERAYSVCLYDGAKESEAWVESVEQGKDICQRFALTGDKSELDALFTAARAQADWFRSQERTALKSLRRCFFEHKPPWLGWTPAEETALEFKNRTAFRTYTICFDPQRRWGVTITRKNEITEGPCFLTREIAKMACACHSHTGEWLGTLAGLDTEIIARHAAPVAAFKQD